MSPDQFKLRIFDKKKNRYYYTNWKNFGIWYSDEDCTKSDVNFDFDPKNHEPQICTYYTDSNGKLLFDGDKVIYQNKDWNVRQNDDYGFELDRSLFEHGENGLYRLNSDVAIVSTKIEKNTEENKLVL